LRRGEAVLSFVENHFDADPAATTFETVFVSLIRQAGALRGGPDRHPCGLFPTATWLRRLDEAGFEAATIDATLPEPYSDTPVFVGLR